VPGGATGGQHVIRSGEVVAERDRSIRADEDSAGIANAGCQGGSTFCLDFQMLRSPGVGHGEGGGGVVHEHARGLAGQRREHSVTMTGGGELRGERIFGAVGEAGVGGDQQARRQRVVLRLGDQVGGDEAWDSGVVGDDRHLGRARLPVGADGPEQQPFGGRDVHVAGAGDDVGSRAVGGAVGEHGDRLRAAGRVHLLDAEHGANGEDDRVRPPAVCCFGRRGDGDLRDPGHLGGDHVHDHRGGDRDQPAGYVHARPADGDIALGDR
jgi:hypothetical protein